ncbi:aspartate-semialdehyde dehydrogenase [Simkania sp.]|uniref:aspartate-semialdehyde dehydrogenase n=1 Tax=Simkania sp. TaxID=34094 RepID=UPI003B52377F
MGKISVGILGATGAVGQTYVKLLENHPLFEIVSLTASPKWEGISYGEALKDRQREDFSEKTLATVMEPAAPHPLIFSALNNEDGEALELELASQGSAVFSHASIHRKSSDIPMIIPEINGEHLALIPTQQKIRGWDKGFLVAKPNCTLQSFLLPLFPLHQKYQLKQAVITTLQSMSGAGARFELEGNVLPFIEGEEVKTEQEPLKILGKLEQGKIFPAERMTFSSHCNRVPVCSGHLACVSAQFEKPVDLESVYHELDSFPSLSLPSAPQKPLHIFEDVNRPQPLLDKDLEGGMSVAIGRLRTCAVFDLRFTALSHNLVRGAAGGSILCAELALQKGYLHG